VRFFSHEESRLWADTLGFSIGDGDGLGFPVDRQLAVRLNVPESIGRLRCLARGLEQALQPRESCLIWVTETGIWPSFENDHLYYRLRQSYGDHRLLAEAPGHLCLGYEDSDAATWIELFMTFGWGFHLLPAAGYGRAYVSHEGFVVLEADGQENLDTMCDDLRRMEFAPVSLSDGWTFAKSLRPVRPRSESDDDDDGRSGG
jgi:hypothetical protein